MYWGDPYVYTFQFYHSGTRWVKSCHLCSKYLFKWTSGTLDLANPLRIFIRIIVLVSGRWLVLSIQRKHVPSGDITTLSPISAHLIAESPCLRACVRTIINFLYQMLVLFWTSWLLYSVNSNICHVGTIVSCEIERKYTVHLSVIHVRLSVTQRPL